MVHASDGFCESGFLSDSFSIEDKFPKGLSIPLSWGYRLAAKFFHQKYDRNPSLQFRAPIPVISVGNLTVGGTGKTPTVIALIELLAKTFPELSEANSIAILSRGYGRKSKKMIEVREDSRWEEAGDEPILIKQKKSNCAVIVNADRRLSAAYAVNRLSSKLLILDDGFQHRALARDIDLICMSGKNPLGNGKLLPAGPLREPVQSLNRATVIIGIGEDTQEAETLAKQYKKTFFSAQTNVKIDTEFHGKNCFLLAGIANPQRFLDSAKSLKLKICGYRFFADHHEFSEEDLKKVFQEAQKNGAEFILTTEKDSVRLRGWNMPLPLANLELVVKFTQEDKFSDYLRQNLFLR